MTASLVPPDIPQKLIYAYGKSPTAKTLFSGVTGGCLLSETSQNSVQI
jgi:hypothetical protein